MCSAMDRVDLAAGSLRVEGAIFIDVWDFAASLGWAKNAARRPSVMCPLTPTGGPLITVHSLKNGTALRDM